MMVSSFRFLACLAFFFGLVAVVPALAAEERAEKPAREPKILDVNITAMESAGLYLSPRDGSLGRDLWSNTPRSAINALLPKLKHPGESRVLQSLTFGLLLSEADARLIEGDVPQEPGHDLLTLRIYQLMKIGAHDKALKFYSNLNAEPYHPNLAQAGIIALLLNGEKSLACLDYKVVEGRGFQGDFWTDIAAYCAYVLNESAGADTSALTSETLKRILDGQPIGISYSPEKLSKPGLFDLGLLIAEDAVSFQTGTQAQINAIAPEHILFAAKRAPEGSREKFLLTMRAVRLGLFSRDEWAAVYGSFNLQNAPFTAGDLVDIQAIEDWKVLPALYFNLKKLKKDSDKWALLEQAFRASEPYNEAGLYPFADTISRLDPSGISLYMKKKAATILHQTDTISRYSDDYYKEFMDIAEKKAGKKAQETLEILAEKIDKPGGDVHNAANVYEKDFGLTFALGYVMPSVQVWDRIRVSSQNQSIGETVLLSTLVLREQKPEDLYPGVLSEVVSSFRATGLNRISKDLANEIVLGIIEE